VHLTLQWPAYTPIARHLVPDLNVEKLRNTVRSAKLRPS